MLQVPTLPPLLPFPPSTPPPVKRRRRHRACPRVSSGTEHQSHSRIDASVYDAAQTIPLGVSQSLPSCISELMFNVYYYYYLAIFIMSIVNYKLCLLMGA